MNRFYKTLSWCFTIILVLIGIHTNAQTPAGSISGTITTSDGKPASNVTVGIKNENKTTATKDDGSFIIKSIKPGTYTLKISSVGLTPQEKEVTVTGGGKTDVSFKLTESLARLDEVAITGYSAPKRQPLAVGKTGIAPRDLPQSVQTFGAEVIADQQVNRLADVLKNVNGVALAENRGSVNETFVARGYSLGTNNVLKNGVRANGGGIPEASTLESVEVLKGSAALLYGGVTGGAIVNMVTKKPKFNFGGEVGFRTGSYDMLKPSVDVYGPISDKVAYRAIVTTENANSFRDDVKTRRVYVNPSMLFKLGKKTELLAQGDFLKSNYTPDFGIGTVAGKIANIGRDAYVNTVWAYNNTTTSTMQANITHQFNDTWKLNTIFGYQGYHRNYFSAERPFATLADGIAARNLTRSKSQEFTYNQQVNLTGAFKTGFVKHQFLFGGDADQSRTTAYSFKYDNNTTAYSYGNINLLNPATYNTRTDIPNTKIVSDTFTPVFRMGSFVSDLLTLTEKFKVLAGIRYTFQKQPRSILHNYETGATTLSNNNINKSKTEDAWSPKVGLIYQPIKSSSVYVSYANNFTSNSGTDVNLIPMTPSVIDQYEAGIKNDFFGGRMSFNVTWYKIVNDKFAQTALFKADGVTPNADANIKEFSGATASDGLEFDVTGKLAKGLNFLAGYSHNYFRYTKTLPTGITEGERIIGSTEHTANGTLFYTFSSGKAKGLKLGTSAFYTGKRNMGFNTLKTGLQRGQPVEVGAFTTVDLSAGYTYKRLSVLGKLANVTDELSYFVHENYSVNPIPPRSFMTTFSYKF
ncbi:TonB-dependent receptor [Hufsiella ginkgonis]|uniref:TonB-dependent siderophore receptor n=1 Tax=Hufsiella ginkgonis TaxID=2695274 RepID=A0A7K1XU25_9SPHI|nr:TonB-dependent receptor [Hufsiella ginkgonis]MXV14505.1 TonB-dependent siderophore receptor [Hufsiella ginkgonis]